MKQERLEIRVSETTKRDFEKDFLLWKIDNQGKTKEDFVNVLRLKFNEGKS